MSNDESEIMILKIYLAYNQVKIEQEDKAIETTNNLAPDVGLFAKAISSFLPDNDVTNFDLREQAICQLIKSHLFFEFIITKNSTRYLISNFYRKFEIFDYKAYLRNILPIAFTFLKASPHQTIDTVAK